PQDAVGGDRLAGGALAHQRQGLAFLVLERDVVDGAVDAVGSAEVRLQILDFEQGHPRHTSLAMRGSSASRSPSPSRFTASTVPERNSAGKKMMNGLTCHSARPSAMMLPQEGRVGGVAAPMNERSAWMIMAVAQR